jgi:hypothetical protein
MKPQSNIMTSAKVLASVALTIGCLAITLHAAPQDKQETSAATTTTKQKQFDDPKQAADSLVQAAEAFDSAALQEILGPDSADIVNSEDAVMDKKNAATFAAAAKEKTAVVLADKNPNRAVVTIGNDGFELPIPLVKNKGKWTFDNDLSRVRRSAARICRGQA